MAHVTEDDEDWIEIEKGAATGPKAADVTVKLTRWTKGGKETVARVNISFRGEAAAWLDENGPRFRVQVGGQQLEKIRIVADSASGRYEHSVMKGVSRIAVGVVSAWPDETRDPVEARWSVGRGHMLLELPRDFAKAVVHVPAAAAPARAPATPASAPRPPAATPPISPRARITDHRVTGTVSMGEPAPGRSALDQRRAAEKK